METKTYSSKPNIMNHLVIEKQITEVRVYNYIKSSRLAMKAPSFSNLPVNVSSSTLHAMSAFKCSRNNEKYQQALSFSGNSLSDYHKPKLTLITIFADFTNINRIRYTYTTRILLD